MKFTSKQLRNLILSEARSIRLRESTGADMANVIAELVAAALKVWFEESGVDLISTNAHDMMEGSTSPDEISPVADEEIDALASSAAEKVLSDADLKNNLTKICSMLLEVL